MKRTALLSLCLVVVAAPLAAMDRIPPGADLFVTRGDGQTYMDFASNPVPAGFFCPGSQPFAGRVEFRGLPIAGAPGDTDTIIERIDEAELNDRGIGSTRIRVRAVQLESLRAVSTSCGDFVLRAYLAPREQPISRMRIHHTERDGGFFTASLALNLRLVFSPVTGKGHDRVLEDTISFARSTRLPWASAPDADVLSRSLTIDTDGDGRPETRIATSTAFVAGEAPGLGAGDGGGLLGAPQALATSSAQRIAVYHDGYEHAHYVDPCTTCSIE